MPSAATKPLKFLPPPAACKLTSCTCAPNALLSRLRIKRLKAIDATGFMPDPAS
ncbi:hypothetical protein [Synechococcus lacustris]|uniref:hypothetical protein n=1 Tax=Synechococcus lacustris TaxID=2116544 RepID=UPI0020CB9403|nr:hypothetical protein [Synechococcus lacustris]MCP9810670.1 hypothetical protein [Synechococcus lacustris Maggiore-St4-Slac]